MEHHANTTHTATTTTTIPTLRQHHQQQQQQQQQQHNEQQQQFCLRWHNHQTSLLSSLPILLDQSHLTDVSISAEGRTLRAHRVVLSACSSFFLELFRALDTSNHPVIIIPGASFAAIVALLTFMYSGEVNVYEEQIPMLLSLAETLGIKGLADVQNNKSMKRQRSDFQPDFQNIVRKEEPLDMPPTTPTPTPPPPPAAAAAAAPIVTPTLPTITSHAATLPHQLSNHLLSNKLQSPLESLLFKSLQFYPNLLPQPLNFSQTALNKTSEFLAKYQQQCGLYEGALATAPFGTKLYGVGEEFVSPQNVEAEAVFNAAKRLCLSEKRAAVVEHQQQQQHIHQLHQQQQYQQQHQQKDIKRIDKIVESLRCSNKSQDVVQLSAAQQQYNLKAGSNMSCNYSTTTAQSASNSSNSSTAIGSKTPTSLAVHYTPTAMSLSQQQQPPAYSHENAQQQQHLPPLYTMASCSNSSSNSDAATTNRSTPNTPDGLKTEPYSPNKATHLATPTSPIIATPNTSMPATKSVSNSKLYATCFICHKQLSNQYNLRVHLETHQNVRYACNVCSHVSRSKDALRKHVSYRHPGAPSPCETEARRKRAASATAKATAASSAAAATSPTSTASAEATSTAAYAGTPASSSSATSPHTVAALSMQLTSPTSTAACNAAALLDTDTAAAAAAYMFLPNQFQLANAAAVAAVAARQQQQENLRNVVTLLGACSNNNSNNAATTLTTALIGNAAAAAAIAETSATAAPTLCPIKTETSQAHATNAPQNPSPVLEGSVEVMAGIAARPTSPTAPIGT